MKKRFIISIIFVLLLAGKVFSQENTDDDFEGGSPYTIFGIGDILYNTSARTNGMGVMGIGLTGDYINNLNPAANNRLEFTKFSLTIDYGYLQSSNGTQTSKVNQGNVNGLNIGIPFNKDNGWVFNFGINPVSNISYKIIANRESNGDVYTNTYEGEGGLTKINLGMTYRLFNALSLGFVYNYGFGNIITQRTIDFENPAYFDTYIRRETDFSNSFFNGGAVFTFENLVNPKSKNLRFLTLGFVYQTGFDLTSNEESIIQSSIGTDSIITQSGTINIPFAYGFGLSNRFGDRVNVALDAYFQQWGDYSEFGVTPSNFNNSARYGAGLELLPSPDRDRSFFEKLTYRAGFFYDKAYYEVNGENINTIGARLGIGIPISDYNSLDINFNYSIRGKEENGLIKDQYFGLFAGVNFGELWFLRPNEDF